MRLPALVALLTCTAFADAQPASVLPAPRLHVLSPLGAKAGSTVELTLSGFDLDDSTGLHFASPGFTAEIIVPPEPKPDPKTKEPPKPKPKGPVTSVKYKVTVPADAALGNHDIRLVSKLGISNPRAFVVGDKPEVPETDKPNDDIEQAQKVELNSTINGTISANADVDYYSFTAKAGQRVLASAVTSSIDSKCRPLVEVFDKVGKRLAGNRNDRENNALADATIPSDGEYYIRICEFAYQSGSNEHFYRLTLSTGPWIDVVYPPFIKRGQATDVTVVGRNLPGGVPMKGMAIDGKPAESLKVSITPPAIAARDGLNFRDGLSPMGSLLDGFEYRLPGSNPIPVYFTDANLHMEATENDKPEKAEAVKAPCDVVGRIDKRYDRDWYSFECKKGDVFYVELMADRIGADMDMYFSIKNAANLSNIVEEQDDDQESLHPQQFFTRSGDPAPVKFTAPADGKYLILVASREANLTYGPRSVYRLRIGKPTPDFRAVVMPKSRDTVGATVAGINGTAALDVFVDRRDGMTAPINVTVTGLPAGVTASPTIIGSGTRFGTVVMNIGDAVKSFTGPITVTCSAKLPSGEVSHTARPASITWTFPNNNNNTPVLSRLDEQCVIAIRETKAHFKLKLDVANSKLKTKNAEGKEIETKLEGAIFVKPGDKLTFPISTTWQGEGTRPNTINIRTERIMPNLQTSPLGTIGENDQNPAGTIAKDKNDGSITLDVRNNALPGTYPLVLRGETQVQFVRDQNKKDAKTNANALAFTEPIVVTVLPMTLGKLTVVQPPNNQLKAGASTELTINFERQFEDIGPLEVKFNVPKSAVGVTIKDTTIPENTSTIKVPIVVDKDAKDVGNIALEITATATLHGKFPIVHTAKPNALRIVPEAKKK
jgi:Bacterial pre-peptidase C-terminal domain